MSFFNNRATAIVLAVILVLGSTLLNVRVKLGNEITEIEDTFYTSSKGERSIDSRISERLSAANGLWTILLKYDEDEADKLADARNALLTAQSAKDISAMSEANTALGEAFTMASAALGQYQLTGTESSAVASYETAFSGAQKMIDESSYNSTVQSFLSGTYNRFPASVLAPLVGLEPPERF